MMKNLIPVQVMWLGKNKRRQETILTEHLEGNLYQVKGPLHLIADLNTDDIIEANVLPGETMPSVSNIVSRSGHKTVHFVFYENLEPAKQQQSLETLSSWGVLQAPFFDRYYTLDIMPEADYIEACKFLEDCKRKEILVYEPDVSIDDLLKFTFLGYF